MIRRPPIAGPGGGGPYRSDGFPALPEGIRGDRAEAELNKLMRVGHTLGMRDAVGRLVTFASGIGLVACETVDLSGMMVGTVFSTEHARNNALLWTVAADVAELRERNRP